MFEKMDLVYEIYMQKSFSKAAAKLFISQPSLSATIKKLEKELGHPLFDRSTIPLSLTDCGVEYIKSVERLREIEGGFSKFLDDLDSANVGNLRIGSTHLYSSYTLSGIIADFIKKYPKIKIAIEEANSAKLEQLLFESELDFIIDNKELDLSLFTQYYYTTENLVLVVPKGFEINNTLSKYSLTKSDITNGVHMSDNIKAVPFDMFEDEPFLLMSEGNDTRIRSDAIFKRFKFAPKVVLELEQLATLFNYVTTGIACSIVNDTVINKISDNDNLVYYKIKAPETQRNVYFYSKQNRYESKAMSVFLSEVLKNKAY